MKKKSKYSNRPHHKSKFQHDPFKMVNCFVPNSIYRELEREAELRGVPLNRLLTSSAMNCLLGNGSFDVDISMPPNPLSSIGLYQEESAVLFRWLSRNITGVSLDLMVMAKDEIGIPNRQVLMLSFYQLLTNGQVELFNVEGQRIPKVRITGTEKLIRRERFKTLAGESSTELSYTVPSLGKYNPK